MTGKRHIAPFLILGTLAAGILLLFLWQTASFRLEKAPRATALPEIAVDSSSVAGISSGTKEKTAANPEPVVVATGAPRATDGTSSGLHGHVLDVQGNPIADVAVDVANGGRARTDANGDFAIGNLSPGPLDIAFEHEGYAPERFQYDAEPGETVEISATMRRIAECGTLTGCVFDARGPVAGQEVRLYAMSDDPRMTVTDVTGRYRFDLLEPGIYEAATGTEPEPGTLETAWTSWRRLAREVGIEAGLTTVADFDFSARTAAVEGCVTVEGSPPNVGHVNIRVTGESGNDDATVALDEAGCFYAAGLVPGTATLSIHIVATDGSSRDRTRTVEMPPGDVLREDIEFTAPACASGVVFGLAQGELCAVVFLEGHTTDSDHVADIIEGQLPGCPWVTVNEQGTFEICGLEPGACTVIAALPALSAQDRLERYAWTTVDLKPGETTEVELTLQDAARQLPE